MEPKVSVSEIQTDRCREGFTLKRSARIRYTTDIRSRQMVKKLTKHGNSLALIIDRPILDLLNIGVDTPLDISTDGQRLIVSAGVQSEHRHKFEKAQRSIHKRFEKALRN